MQKLDKYRIKGVQSCCMVSSLKHTQRTAMVPVYCNSDLPHGVIIIISWWDYLQGPTELKQTIVIMGAFLRPIDEDQVLTTWSEGRQNGLLLNSRLCGVTAPQSSESDIKFQKKATINLLKCLLGFKSILYLISSTQHTQACVS